jgi:hypothetical protein
LNTYPFVIWCRQRTGSISLFAALCSASEHTPAEIEPFDFGPTSDRQFSNVGKRMPWPERDRALRKICDGRLLIKHCYENLSEEFNLALAWISTRAGYRHIHLTRRDEIARLVSKGIAERHGTWGAHDWTRHRFREYLVAGRGLPPLDVPMLRRYHEDCERKWRRVGPLLKALEVAFEDLFGPVKERTLARIALFLSMPEASANIMAANLGHGQDTRAIWKLIPNIDELRKVVAV